MRIAINRFGSYAVFVIVLAILMLALSACSPQGEHVKADRAFYDAIAPAHLELLDGARRATATQACEHCKQVPTEPWFTDDVRALKRDTVSVWDLHIRKSEGK